MGRKTRKLEVKVLEPLERQLSLFDPAQLPAIRPTVALVPQRSHLSLAEVSPRTTAYRQEKRLAEERERRQREAKQTQAVVHTRD